MAVQSDWDEPSLPQWSAKVRRELNRVPGRVWIVAHSFGCLAAVQAAFDYRERISGVMLVAPADPSRFGLQNVISASALGVPSVVVASTNDPWMSFDRAAAWADAWGAELINIGAAGHINVRSGHGPWPRGLSILCDLRQSKIEFLPERHRSDELYHQSGEF
jgi:predicted alpha/beta hydrolase family esterase